MDRVAMLVAAARGGATLRFSAEAFRDWTGDGCSAWGLEQEVGGSARETARGREGESDGEAGGGIGVQDFKWMHGWVRSAMRMCLRGGGSVLCSLRGAYAPTAAMHWNGWGKGKEGAGAGRAWSREARALYAQMRCLGRLDAAQGSRNTSSRQRQQGVRGEAGGGDQGREASLTQLYQFDPWLLDCGADSDFGSWAPQAPADTWHGGQQVYSTDAGDEVVEAVVGGWSWALASSSSSAPHAIPTPTKVSRDKHTPGEMGGAQREWTAAGEAGVAGGEQAGGGIRHQVLRGGIVRHLRMLRSVGASVVIANHEIHESVLWLIAGPSAKIVRVKTRDINDCASEVHSGPSPGASCAQRTTQSRLARSLMRKAACDTLAILQQQGRTTKSPVFLEAPARLHCHSDDETASGGGTESENATAKGHTREESQGKQHGWGARGGTDRDSDKGNRGEARDWQVPVVMVCVGVPWDMVLQGMLHAALGPGGGGGERGDLGRVLTLDVSAVASTLGQSRSGFAADGRVAEAVTGDLIGAQPPRADPLDYPSLVRHFAHSLQASRHVALLVTTALVRTSSPSDDRFSREALYEEMFVDLAAAGYPRPFVVEAVHGYTGEQSELLERHASRVLYTLVNDFQNQGINEFRSVREALLAFDLASADRLVVKHTGRYTFVDTLLLDIAEANADVDVIVRPDQGAIFTGTFAMRGSLLLRAIDLLDIVDMESQSINVETALWHAVVQLCDKDTWPLQLGAARPSLPDCRVVYLDRIGVRARYESGRDRIW